jgi:hypothetical protein
MMTLFRYALRRFRGQVLGWGLALFLLGAMSVARYEVMRDNQELIQEMIKGSAGRFIGMFGDPGKLTSPEGFLCWGSLPCWAAAACSPPTRRAALWI